MLSYIFEKNMKKVLVILNYYKYGHAYIYIYMYSRFRIYFLDILNDSLNAFSYRFIYIVAVYYKKTTCMYIVILDLELYIHFY